MPSQPDTAELNIREQIARIDKLLADIHAQPEISLQRQAQIAQAHAQAEQARFDTLRKQQERRFAPWQVAFAGMTAGAVLFAAGGALVKFFG
jgi:hypothetical protein